MKFSDTSFSLQTRFQNNFLKAFLHVPLQLILFASFHRLQECRKRLLTINQQPIYQEGSNRITTSFQIKNSHQSDRSLKSLSLNRQQQDSELLRLNKTKYLQQSVADKTFKLLQLLNLCRLTEWAPLTWELQGNKRVLTAIFKLFQKCRLRRAAATRLWNWKDPVLTIQLDRWVVRNQSAKVLLCLLQSDRTVPVRKYKLLKLHILRLSGFRSG